MDMKTFLKLATPERRKSLAFAVGTSVNYLYQIAGGHKQPGPKLAKKIFEAEPQILLHELRPDIWQATPIEPRSDVMNSRK